MLFRSLLAFGLFAVSTLASPIADPENAALPERAKPQNPPYPFNRMVAFGDSLSDNGNGSWAHGLADPKHPTRMLYGYPTWTNGPVAVSFLSDLLGVPLTANYAFGGAYGGSKLGATINSSYTYSQYAPDAFTQLKNYSSTKPSHAKVANTLHFVWIGNNDVNLRHINVNLPTNPSFAAAMANQMETLVQRMVDLGAKHIFVVGIFPRQLSAWRKYMARNELQILNLGLAIQQANRAIKRRMAQKFREKVIYYDVFHFMTKVYNNHDEYGIEFVLPHYCDGHDQADYKACLVPGLSSTKFYWVAETDPTTRVHSLIAGNMARVIRKAFS